jgi:hypothetical protein
MFGSFKVEPTTPEDLPELSEFLTAGFGLPPETEHLSEPVLRWKYFDPGRVGEEPFSLVARAGGRVVGHVGMVRRDFRIVGNSHGQEVPLQSSGSGGAVSALHFIDLLASPEHPSAGLMLMKRGFRSADVQYTLGGSADGQRMALATGYVCRLEFPTFWRILRPTHRWRVPGSGLVTALGGVTKDVGRYLANPVQAPRRAVALRAASRFGPEIEDVLRRWPQRLALTSRTSALLNHYLDYPAGIFNGWTLHEGGRVVGFAVLSIVRDASVRRGKIVECMLDGPEPDLWHAAIVGLAQELKDQGADTAGAFGSTPWVQMACRQAGFQPLRRLQTFFCRDDRALLPHEVPFHLTQLEGDHGYL